MLPHLHRMKMTKPVLFTREEVEAVQLAGRMLRICRRRAPSSLDRAVIVDILPALNSALTKIEDNVQD